MPPDILVRGLLIVSCRPLPKLALRGGGLSYESELSVSVFPVSTISPLGILCLWIVVVT